MSALLLDVPGPFAFSWIFCRARITTGLRARSSVRASNSSSIVVRLWVATPLGSLIGQV
jgi:hypothetical protein